MPVKMFGVTLWVVLLAASVSGVIGRWNDDQTQSCDEEIKEMLHILTNEVAELKKEVQEMNRGRNPEGEKTKEPEKNTDSELKILSVNRKALVGRDGQYTVRYQVQDNNSSLPIKAFWKEYLDHKYTNIPEKVSNEIPNLPPGVFETSITTTAQNDSHLMVSIGHSNKRWLGLYLTNDDVNDMTETDIKTPLLDILPEGDIVYEPGHNATATILFPPEKKRDGPGSDFIDQRSFYSDFVLTKPGFQEIITKFNKEGNLVHLDNKRKFVDKIELKIVIQTEDTSYSGLFEMSSGDTKETGLVRRVENHKEVALRPSSQKEAFPEGKIYVRQVLSDISRYKRNENGDYIIFCAYGKMCKKYCAFYGNNLSKLELFKTVNGTTTREHIELYNVGQVTNTLSGMFEVSPTASDPSPVVYTCRASNTKGQTLDTNTVVTFGYRAKILVNESSMEKLDDTTAKLVCTARGQPVANVTIQCGGFAAEDSEIVYQSHDEIQVTATCYYVNKYAFLGCSAYNGFQSDNYLFDEEGLLIKFADYYELPV